MAEKWPDINVVQSGDGDDATYAPQKTDRSLLAAERGSQNTRRLETDADRNLFVRIAADDTNPAASSGVSPLATGAQTNVPASTLTTLVTYTAVVASRATKVSCGGTIYAKFQLFKNLVLIDTHRSGPDRAIQLVFDSGLALAPGDILEVKVTHFVTGELEDFEATVYGV